MELNQDPPGDGHQKFVEIYQIWWIWLLW